MNQLFSKKRIVEISIIGAFLILCSFNSIVENEANEAFLKRCKNSDAYYLYSYTDVSYSRNYWSSYKKHISVSSKLVVNNTTGVNEYAFLSLSAYVSNRLKEIKIRTLKADGTIVELDSSLVFQRNSVNKKFGDINYPIPGVEPGDTIETVYVYSEILKKNELIEFVSLNANIPSLNSQYTIRSEPDLLIRYKAYNNFPEPEVVSNDTLIYLSFSMDTIKGLVENEYNCLPCELPYLYYSLENKNGKTRTWRDVYNQEFNAITQPIALDYEKSSYYKRWKKRAIGTAKDSSKYHKFNLLHAKILNTVQMEPFQMEELIKSSGYFLKKNRFDPISIRRLYRQILEDLEIDYWAVFARSKRTGPIDPYFIRNGEFDHIFFAFENENGSVNLLYPHEEFYMYQIDEIPTSLYNTEAVLVKPNLKEKKKKKDKFIDRNFKLAEVDSVSMATITLPGMSANHNYIKQVIYSEVNIEKKKTTFKYRFKASGGLSTELRSFFDMMDQNEEVSDFYDALAEFEGNDNTMHIDTVNSVKLSVKKPFTYTLTGEGTINDAIIFLNDSLVSISIDNLIQHNQIETNTDTSELNYYLDYSYKDYFMLLLNFPCDIDVLGIENGNIDSKNEFGEYFFEIKIVNGNQLKLQSNYKIIKDLIPKEEYNQLKALNDLVKDVKNRRLLVKLKKQ